jgi:hypothetical protein
MTVGDSMLLIVGVPGTAVVILSYILAERRRTAVIKKRAVMNIEDWLKLYYPNAANQKKTVINEILSKLAEEIGVEPTQFLPSDRFDKELALKNVLLDDGLDGFSEWLYRESMRIFGTQLRGNLGWYALGDVFSKVGSLPVPK